MEQFKINFINNFITDNRYMYLVQGLGKTLLLTAFAAIIGIVLGFLVAIIRSTYEKTGKLKIANAICSLYLTVIRGTPAVVQLLIMFYVVFASYNNSTVVAIINFGIN